MTKKSLIAFSLALSYALSLPGYAQSLNEARLHGNATFWSRSGEPPLPRPLSEPEEIEVAMKKPSHPNEAFYAKRVVSEGDLTAEITFVWVTPPANGSDYIVTQIQLMHGPKHTPLALCNWYSTPKDSIPFPVGVCSGYLQKGLERIHLGITLSRATH